mgnify:CR=1 FL=1
MENRPLCARREALSIVTRRLSKTMVPSDAKSAQSSAMVCTETPADAAKAIRNQSSLPSSKIKSKPSGKYFRVFGGFCVVCAPATVAASCAASLSPSFCHRKVPNQRSPLCSPIKIYCIPSSSSLRISRPSGRLEIKARPNGSV